MCCKNIEYLFLCDFRDIEEYWIPSRILVVVFLGALLIMSIIAWIFCIQNLYLEWQESARQNSINRLDLTAPQDTPVVVKVPQSEPAQIQNYVTTEETPLLPREAIRNKRRRSEPAQMQSFVNSESTPLIHREVRRVRRQHGKSNLRKDSITSILIHRPGDPVDN